MNAMKSGITMLLVVLALALSGCAAIPLSLASGAFSGGAGAAVNAGTEYASGGVVYRTFTLPLDELRLALGDALARMEIAVVRDEVVGDERRIEAHAHERVIKLRLEPVSRTVTRLRLVVSEKPFKKDRATASEIVTQTERAVVERVASVRAERRVTRDARGADASCPPRVARAREMPREQASPPCRGPGGSRPRTTSTRAE